MSPRLAWTCHEWVTDLLCDVSLLRRIALRYMEASSSTGFSLCGLVAAHRQYTG